MDAQVQPPLTLSPPDRARLLRPLLDEHGAEIDRRRELTPEAVEGLFAQDLLRVLLPASIGGQEAHLLDHCKTAEALGYADASTGWFYNQSNVSAATAAAAMPREAAAAIFDGPRTGLAWGAKHSKSKAIRVPGGYRLTGEWGYGSGSRHTTWIGAHSMVQNPDGTPHIRYGKPDDRSFVFLKSKAKVTDDWQVLGLRGTGSDTYSVEDLFIPDEHAPARDAQEERREKGPLYVIISNLLYASGFCGVALGVGRRMLETYTELARGKTSRAAINSMANNNAVQLEIAQLEAKLSAARAFVHEAICQAYEAAQQDRLDVDLRMRLRLATTFAMQQAGDVAYTSYRSAGTTAILNSAPFERRFRDAMSVSQHLQGMNAHVEMVGRHLIGSENVVQWV
jgi:alkylation response protein AidB-like acyl-CoA dehydrogenase